MTGWLRAHRRVADAALAALVLAMFEMPAFDPYRHHSRQWWPVWGFVIAVPLLWRRSRPVAALAISLLGSAAALVTRAGPNWGALSQATVFVGPAVALATAGALLPRPVSTRLVAVAVAFIAGVTLVTHSAPDALVAQLVIVGGAWAVGEAFRARRHEIALLGELVERRAEQAADLERHRIAREVHDVVAHQLAVIAIQGGAARLIAGPASPLAEPLAAIEEASCVALSDVRRALGVLRRDQLPSGVGRQPGLEGLDGLACRLRHAGLPVQLTTSGDLEGVPVVVGATAFRVVQEALTNVLNHAGAVATHVRVARTAGRLELHVRNDRTVAAPRASRDGGGRGLLGMRERVAACGGTLDAGPLPSGGFAVSARIPLP
jgi:signal transduction histidine kinase